jgi:hypothetical protein
MTKTAKQLIASKKPATKKLTLQSYLSQGRPVTSDSIGYILRCNASDLTSKNQFKWVTQGPVEASDWQPIKKCGNGLHGWLWGEGDHTVSDHWYNPKAIWLVAAVWLADTIDIQGKVKFPRAWVVYSGTRDEATREIVKLGSKKPVMFVNLTAGDNEAQVGGFQARLTGGDWSTNTGGYKSTNTGGNYSTNTGGDGSTNIGGYRSTNTGGNYSTNTGGNKSTNTGGNESTNTGGDRSTNTGGNKSTNTGGDWSTNTGGTGSTNKGGDYSTNKGGDYSTNKGGNGSTNTGGDYSINTGGNNSTLIWKIWDGTRYRLHLYYTGEDGILPNVPYKWINGKPVAQK